MKEPRVRWTLTSAQELSRRQTEMSALELSAGVLSFCAEQDPHAAHFLKVMNLFRVKVNAQGLMRFEGLQNPFVDQPSWGLGTPSLSRTSASALSSETEASRGLSDPAARTQYSSLDLRANSDASDYPVTPSVHSSNPLASPFGTGLAQIFAQNNAYPIPLDWRLSSTFATASTWSLGLDYDAQDIKPATRSYQSWS